LPLATLNRLHKPPTHQGLPLQRWVKRIPQESLNRGATVNSTGIRPGDNALQSHRLRYFGGLCPWPIFKLILARILSSKSQTRIPSVGGWRIRSAAATCCVLCSGWRSVKPPTSAPQCENGRRRVMPAEPIVRLLPPDTDPPDLVEALRDRP